MRTRILIAAFALALAGCSSGAATTTTAAAEPATTTTTTQPAVPAAVLAYSYTAGDSYTYDISLGQHLTMTTNVEGDPGMFDGADAPGSVDVDTSVDGTVHYDISDGPEADTTTMHISGTFDDVSVEGTVDGEPVTDSDVQSGTVPDLVEVPDTTIVLDKYGRPVSVDGTTVPSDAQFFGDPFALFGGLTSGGLDQPFGPEFPDHALTVGDSWTQEESQDIPDTDQTVAMSVTYTVTGTDTIDGHDVTVIDFSATSSGADVDLGQMFQALIEGFASMGQDTSTTAPIPTIDFVVSIGESSGSGTYWFDQEAGIVRKVSQTYSIPMSMHMGVSSSDGTGSADVQMSVESSVDAQLTEGATAG
jgi:hypothetical protein